MTRPGFRNGTLVTSAVIAIATWLFGWWAVPIVAFVAGLMLVRPSGVAVAATLAWAALLALDAMHASFASLVVLLSDIMGFPAVVLVILTLLFPALLGWSAATIGNAIRATRPGAMPLEQSPGP